jgi:hypothetical protein
MFKPTVGNESLHEFSKGNGNRVVNVATSKNLVVKSTMFPHRNIHINTPGPLLRETHTTRLITF